MNDSLHNKALVRGLSLLESAAKKEMGSFATDDGVVHRLLNNVWGSSLVCIGTMEIIRLVPNTEASVSCLACLAQTVPTWVT